MTQKKEYRSAIRSRKRIREVYSGRNPPLRFCFYSNSLLFRWYYEQLSAMGRRNFGLHLRGYF